MTDEEFQAAIDALSRGDKNALRCIYEAYVRLIYAVALDVVKRREEAEDITSEFFIKLIRIAGGFKKGSPHKAWMVKIVRNMAIDSLRKSSREVLEYAADDTEAGENGDAGGRLERAGAKEHAHDVEQKAVLAEDMRRAMQCLKPKEKEIIDMKLLGQLTFKEIAGITGQPMGTVTWLYNQGIQKLRRCLAEYERE